MTTTDFLRLLVATPLLVWVPGWLAWRTFWGEEAIFLDRSERVFLHLFVSLLVSAGLATLLAELGAFSLVSLLTGLILTCLVMWRLGIGDWRLGIIDWRLEIRSPLSNLQSSISNLQSPISLWNGGLLVILALAASLFLRPAEAILVMDDSGVYVIHGLTLARTGGLAVRDVLLPSLPPAAAEQVLPFVRYESSYIRHGGAFHIWHWGRGLVLPSFFHLPSIWMAVLGLIAGPRAAIWATPLVGLVAVGGLALLGRRLFGPAPGLTAALLLTLSFPQVWYARYPTSEMFAQAWLLGGLFLLAVFLQHRSRYVAIVAGVGLGQLLLIRIDAVVAAAAIGVCFAGWFLGERPASSDSPTSASDRWFLWPFGLTLVYAGLHATLFASPYVISLMHLYLTPWLGAIAILGLAVVAVVGFVGWRRSRVLQVGRRCPEPVEGLKAGTLKVPGSNVSLWIAGSILAGMGAVISVVGTHAPIGIDAVRWLGWYVSPVGLVAGLVGLVLIIRHGVSRPVQVVLVIALLYALLYLPAPRVRPVQPWGIRRFVPAVLPTLALVMAYLATRFPVPGPERLRLSIRIVLVLALTFPLAQRVWPVLTHDEYAGVWDQVEALAGQFEPGSIVLFNRTGVGQAIAQPLTYLYDRPAFVLQEESPNVQIIKALADQWLAAGRPVYLAVTGLAPWLANLGVGVVPTGDFTLRILRLERPTTHAPREAETLVWPIELYRLVPGGGRGPASRLEMETGELVYVRGGFYEREVAPDDTTFRWTDGDGRLRLSVAPKVHQLILRTAGPPVGGPSVKLTVLIDGSVSGAWEQTSSFTVHRLDVPAQAASDGWLNVELRSDTWVPKQAGLGDDERRLGIVLDWVAVE